MYICVSCICKSDTCGILCVHAFVPINSQQYKHTPKRRHKPMQIHMKRPCHLHKQNMCKSNADSRERIRTWISPWIISQTYVHSAPGTPIKAIRDERNGFDIRQRESSTLHFPPQRERRPYWSLWKDFGEAEMYVVLVVNLSWCAFFVSVQKKVVLQSVTWLDICLGSVCFCIWSACATFSDPTYSLMQCAFKASKALYFAANITFTTQFQYLCWWIVWLNVPLQLWFTLDLEIKDL